MRVEGESLWPYLVSGRRYPASGLLRPHVGDYAVFRNPRDPERVFVKRVAAICEGGCRMESAVSWGLSTADFGLVTEECIMGKILIWKKK